jgi:hypothetical protein
MMNERSETVEWAWEIGARERPARSGKMMRNA